MTVTTFVQPPILYDNQEDQTRVVELSASYEGLPGCYHSLARKLAIFEREEVVLQWHGGINAPVDLRMTFAELDTLIAHFNAYCETYGHMVPDADPLLPNWDQVAPEPCSCSICTSQDAHPGLSYVARPALSLALVRDLGPSPAIVTERCSGICWLCDEPCAHSANHDDSCYCSAHSRT
jgi:hypothetical protein